MKTLTKIKIAIRNFFKNTLPKLAKAAAWAINH